MIRIDVNISDLGGKGSPFPTKIQSKLNWLFLYVLVRLVLVLFRNLYQILFLYVLAWLVLVLFRNLYQILFLYVDMTISVCSDLH
jgi:hypothetical protein